MEAYLVYIGKAALAAGAFYLAFLLLFQNQKQFVFNRLYLPVSFALSFVIPLITFTSIKYIEAVPLTDFNGFTYLPNSAHAVEQAPFVFDWYHYLFAFYVLGAVFFLFRLLIGHLKAISMVVKSHVQKLFGIEVHVTPADVHPFSFFSKIVVSEKTLGTPNLKMIVEHENIHVREKHTLDILFAEILFLAQWFNPFAWLLKDAVNNNLEYLTDDQIAQNHNPKEYQLAMVALADKKGVAPFLNALNGSQLKNRIIMMKKKAENKYALLKQLVVLPLLAVLVMGLSNKEVKTEIIQPVSVDSNQISPVIQTEHIVKGKVINEKDEPIPNAAVIIKGKTTGTITNNSGEYEIRLEDKNEVLVFSKPGYLYREVRVKGREKINVLLYDDKKATNEEVIANGYATKQEADISNGIANDSEVHINSNTKERPLYVVDGVETDNIEAINQYNIENIDVLKDKSATALYGKKGKNGVVVITLKGTGKSKETNTTFISKQKTGVGQVKNDDGSVPLYIVNGVEKENINDLPPQDLKSVNILKGESATELYGEKGKNGVIVISTTTAIDDSSTTSEKEFTVSGKVTDDNGQPLSGVSILIKGKTLETTTTDSNGNYEIRSDGEIEMLVFGKDGFETLEVKTDGNKNIEVKLELDNKLYIVDGKEYDTKTSEIDTKNIERIDILKGESGFKFYGEKGKNGVVIISTKDTVQSKKINTTVITTQKTDAGETKENGDPVFYKVDQMPEFPGGEIGLRSFIAQSIKYPEIAAENGIQGKVYVTFVIAKNGDVKDPTIALGVDPALDKEALRVVSTLPKWRPGRQKGEAVNVSYTVPITFKLQGQRSKTVNLASGISEIDPLYVVNGVEKEKIADLNVSDIKSIDVLKGESATSLYGEKGKNGVILVTLKEANETPKITSLLEFRKFIANEIVYPEEAVETNTHGAVSFFFRVDKNGNIFDIKAPKRGDLSLEEVVVVGYKTKIPGRDIKNSEWMILTNEVERVLKAAPALHVPEFYEKSIKINVKFELQD